MLSNAFQTLNAMERQDLEDAIPCFQEMWTKFDPKGSGNLPPKHLFTVRDQLTDNRHLAAWSWNNGVVVDGVCLSR